MPSGLDINVRQVGTAWRGCQRGVLPHVRSGCDVRVQGGGEGERGSPAVFVHCACAPLPCVVRVRCAGVHGQRHVHAGHHPHGVQAVGLGVRWRRGGGPVHGPPRTARAWGWGWHRRRWRWPSRRRGGWPRLSLAPWCVRSACGARVKQCAPLGGPDHILRGAERLLCAHRAAGLSAFPRRWEGLPTQRALRPPVKRVQDAPPSGAFTCTGQCLVHTVPGCIGALYRNAWYTRCLNALAHCTETKRHDTRAHWREIKSPCTATGEVAHTTTSGRGARGGPRSVGAPWGAARGSRPAADGADCQCTLLHYVRVGGFVPVQRSLAHVQGACAPPKPATHSGTLPGEAGHGKDDPRTARAGRATHFKKQWGGGGG